MFFVRNREIYIDFLRSNDALSVAVDYTVECILLTLADPDYNWYGVNFEQAIPYLLKRMGE